MCSSLERMAWRVLSISSSRGQPSRSAPSLMTSREQPAANFLSLNFFFRELTSISWQLLLGRISAAALMRPSKSCQDMEVSSLKKKFKDKKFAAGCSRDVIKEGAERLGWPLEELMDKTLQAMRSSEEHIAAELANL